MLSCGHKTHRLVGLAVALLALALPSAASAAESAYVSSGTLVYSNSPGEADHLTIANGGASYPGLYRVSEPNTPAAFAGVGCTQLGLGEAVCGGTVSQISVNTTSGDDRVTIDVGLPATIYGLTEHDVLTGGSAADYIYGGLDNDTVHGRGGVDWLSGDDGNDVIEARDGLNDFVLCGGGIDTAYIDAGEGSFGCETVISDQTPSPVYTPPTPGAPDTPEEPVADDDPADDRSADPVADDVAGDDAATDDEFTDLDGDGIADAFDPDVVPALSGPLQLTSAVIAVSAKGVASLELTCAATEVAGCRGQVFLDPVLTKGKDKAKGKAKVRRAKVRAVASRRGRFGHSKFVIASGKRKKLDVRLSGGARKALGLLAAKGKARAARRGRSVRARVTVVQTGRRAQKTVVTLRG